MAYKELRRLGSPVKVPALYYACELEIPREEDPDGPGSRMTYIVMEFIAAKPVAEPLQNIDQTGMLSTHLHSRIAFALSELQRIPIPEGSRPAAVDGDKIRNPAFDEFGAPRHYRNVMELEEHINAFLSLARHHYRVQNLKREPLVFCYSDVWLGNFLIDDNEDITVIDFEEASILPSSFAKFALAISYSCNNIQQDIRPLVAVPETEGVDNVSALHAFYGRITIGGGFAMVGRKLFGDYDVEKRDLVHKVATDSQGCVVYHLLPSIAPVSSPESVDLSKTSTAESPPPSPPRPFVPQPK